MYVSVCIRNETGGRGRQAGRYTRYYAHSGSLPSSIASRRSPTSATARLAASMVLASWLRPRLRPTTTLPPYWPASARKRGPYVRSAGASRGSATLYSTYAADAASYSARSCVVPPIRIGGHTPVSSRQLARHRSVAVTLVKYDGKAKNSKLSIFSIFFCAG